jgi:DNA-directed RNA polymerase specialized sigma24 family protein
VATKLLWESFTYEAALIAGGLQQERHTFATCFLRSRPLLYKLAERILGNHEESEVAVQNCFESASYDTPYFESEGAFRSWLVRVLMDEALAILRERRTKHAFVTN